MAEQGGVYIVMRGMSGELGIPIWTAISNQPFCYRFRSNQSVDKIADSYKSNERDFIMSWSRKSKDKLNNTGNIIL